MLNVTETAVCNFLTLIGALNATHPPDKKANSSVWNYYGVPAYGDLVIDNIIICKLCKYSYSFKDGNTTNFISHIKNYHASEFLKFNSRKSVLSVSTIMNSDFVAQSFQYQFDFYWGNSFCKKTKDFAKFPTLIIHIGIRGNSNAAFHFFESKPFVKIPKTLNSLYILPGRKYFYKYSVPKSFIEIKKKRKSDICLANNNNMSMNTDCWTSVSSVPFTAVMAHYIDNNWKLKSPCLCCMHFDDDYTAENINEILQEKLSKWNFNINNLCSCTTDSGENILKAITLSDVQHLAINIAINKALQILKLNNLAKLIKVSLLLQTQLENI